MLSRWLCTNRCWSRRGKTAFGGGGPEIGEPPGFIEGLCSFALPAAPQCYEPLSAGHGFLWTKVRRDGHCRLHAALSVNGSPGLLHQRCRLGQKDGTNAPSSNSNPHPTHPLSIHIGRIIDYPQIDLHGWLIHGRFPSPWTANQILCGIDRRTCSGCHWRLPPASSRITSASPNDHDPHRKEV
jgi:hypothetical protein